MNLRAFVLGLIWAGLSALGPAVIAIADDYQHNEFTDWHRLRRQSAAMALLGVSGYWRKHKALLKLPPYLAGTITDSTVQKQSELGE